MVLEGAAVVRVTVEMLGSLTCVQPLTQLFDLIGGTRLPVDPFGVEAMHLDVVDELLHQLWHRSLLAGQTG